MINSNKSKLNKKRNSRQASTELVAPKAKRIKLGVDVHLDRYVVVRLIEGGTPQPPQRFDPAGFLLWVDRYFALDGVDAERRTTVAGDAQAPRAFSGAPRFNRFACYDILRTTRSKLDGLRYKNYGRTGLRRAALGADRRGTGEQELDSPRRH